MFRSASMLLCAVAVTVTSGCTGGRIAHSPTPGQHPARSAAMQAGYETTGDDVVIRGQSYTQMAEGNAGHPLGTIQSPATSFSTRRPLDKSHMPVSELGAAIDDKLHNTRVGYYDNSTPVCGGVGSPMDPMCPTCPGAGYGCRGGACGPNGCGVQCVRNHHSYRVEQPKNLSYPAQNAVGGAVVYPYYTHKGPSDFFRDDPSRR